MSDDGPIEIPVGRLIIEHSIDADGADVSTTMNDNIPVLTALGLLRVAEMNLINGQYNVPDQEDE